MLQRGEQHHLTSKPLGARASHDVRAQRLERDASAKRYIGGEEHPTHAAARFALDDVPLAKSGVQGSANIHARRCASREIVACAEAEVAA